MIDVAIFRNELFKVSETFITQQASRLVDCRVLYVGRKRLAAAPIGARSVALEDLPGQRSRLTQMWHLGTRDPRPYQRLLKGSGTSLLHAHFGVDAVYAAPLARALNLPLVTTFHGFDATTRTESLLQSGKPAWVNYVLHRKELARSGNLFLCVSNHIRQRVLRLGFPEERTRVHFIGVDTESIKPPVKKGDRPAILHVGRLVEKKGTKDLIAAFKVVLRKHPDAELQIVGSGPLEATLREQAAALGLKRSVSFLGALPHECVLELMRRAWVFCLPSVTARSGDTEGLPIVLLEAAALGLPVVSTLHAGIPEAVIDEVTGLLVDEHDQFALAERLSYLIANTVSRERYGLAARRHVEVSFDVRGQSRLLSAMYAELI